MVRKNKDLIGNTLSKHASLGSAFTVLGFADFLNIVAETGNILLGSSQMIRWIGIGLLLYAVFCEGFPKFMGEYQYAYEQAERDQQ